MNRSKMRNDHKMLEITTQLKRYKYTGKIASTKSTCYDDF